jgi:hypothetical protein
MSQIQALTSHISDLDRSLNSWSYAYVVFVLLTVFLAVGLFVTQFVAIRKGRELAAAQSELLRLKDDELKKDLGEKDEKIAGLNLQAESLKTEAEKAKEGIATAQMAAARANADAAKAGERAAEANKAAEQEKIERLKLEAQIAPRRLTVAQQQAIAMGCSHFSGKSVRVESYALDAEAGILAKQIIAALQASGMHVQDGTASLMPLGGFSLGVHVNGDEPDLVTGLSAILSSVGNLFVAPPNSIQGGGETISAGSGAPRPSVSILVGVKPVQ